MADEKYIEMTLEDLEKKVAEIFDQKIKEMAQKPEPESRKEIQKAEMWKETIRKALSLSGTQIPAELYADVLTSMGKYGIFRQKAILIEAKRDTKVPVGAEAIAYDTSELGTIPELNLNLSLADFTLRKIAALVVVTNEMLESWDITNWITRTIALALAKKEDSIGISNVAESTMTTVVTVNGLSGITYDKLADVVGAISSNYDSTAMWLLSQSAYSQILKLKDSANRPLFDFQGGIKTIMGYPYIKLKDEMFPQNHYLLFGSFDAVGFAYVPGVRMDTFNTGNVGTINLLQNDAIALRATERFNAKPLFDGAWAVIKQGA
jgi:HK97 family phage major capsid protein